MVHVLFTSTRCSNPCNHPTWKRLPVSPDVSPAPSLTAGGKTGGGSVPPVVPHEAPAPMTQGRGFPVLSDPKASDSKEFGKIILEGTQT